MGQSSLHHATPGINYGIYTTKERLEKEKDIIPSLLIVHPYWHIENYSSTVSLAHRRYFVFNI